MRLTTRRCYAVTAMLDVAINQNKGPVSLADISQRRGISQSYLEQLFAKLRRGDLVKSVRGPGGGYMLNRELDKLTVAEVINAIDDRRVGKPPCTDVCNCQTGNLCLTKNLWEDVGKLMFDHLSGITYADLMAELPAQQ